MENSKQNDTHKTTRKTLGTIGVCINAWLVFAALRSYYLLNLVYCTCQNWVLFATALFGVIGIYVSILLLKERIRIKVFLITTLVIWLIIFVFSNFFEIMNEHHCL